MLVIRKQKSVQGFAAVRSGEGSVLITQTHSQKHGCACKRQRRRGRTGDVLSRLTVLWCQLNNVAFRASTDIMFSLIMESAKDSAFADQCTQPAEAILWYAQPWCV